MEWSRRSRPRASSRRTRKEVTGPRRTVVRGGAGQRVRAARPERRRQVDRGQDPHHADHARTPAERHRGRDRRARPARRRAPDDRRGGSGLGRRHPGHRAREPAPAGPDPRDPRAGRIEERAAGAARALRTGRRRRPDRARLLAAGCSAGWTSRWRSSTTPPCCSSTSRPPGSIPRSGPTCGRRSRALAGERGKTRAADHALPRGGRPARRAGGDRRPRARSWPRARPMSSSASCAATPSTSISRPSTTAPSAGRSASWRRSAT